MSINDIMERMGEPSYWDGSGAPGQYMYYQMVVNYHWLCIDILLKQEKIRKSRSSIRYKWN